MSKRELIDEIIRVNRTATPEFLARFAESDLKAYLDRVCLSAARPEKHASMAADCHQHLVLA